MVLCAFAVSEFCANKSDSNYPFEKTCAQSFVMCTGGSPSITHCPMNTRYSPAEDACLDPTRVSCGVFTVLFLSFSLVAGDRLRAEC